MFSNYRVFLTSYVCVFEARARCVPACILYIVESHYLEESLDSSKPEHRQENR